MAMDSPNDLGKRVLSLDGLLGQQKLYFVSPMASVRTTQLHNVLLAHI